MNEGMVRTFQTKRVRIIIRDGKEWFVAKDAADILDIQNIRQNLVDFPDKEKGVYSIYTPGGEQKMQFINEPGIYRLIFKSRKPEAESFKSWVFEEVLPSVRNTGAYTATPKTYPETPEALVKSEKGKPELRAENAAKERRPAVAEPKAAFTDRAVRSEDALRMNGAAKVLKPGYGNITLFRKLREMKILTDDNVPYREYVGRGYFKVDEKPVLIGDTIRIKKVTKVTRKGWRGWRKPYRYNGSLNLNRQSSMSNIRFHRNNNFIIGRAIIFSGKPAYGFIQVFRQAESELNHFFIFLFHTNNYRKLLKRNKEIDKSYIDVISI